MTADPGAEDVKGIILFSHVHVAVTFEASFGKPKFLI